MEIAREKVQILKEEGVARFQRKQITGSIIRKKNILGCNAKHRDTRLMEKTFFHFRGFSCY